MQRITKYLPTTFGVGLLLLPVTKKREETSAITGNRVNEINISNGVQS